KADGGRLRLGSDWLETISTPARSARVLLSVVGVFVAFSTVGLHLIIAAVEPQVAAFGLGFWISAAVLLLILGLFVWLLRTGSVHMRASAGGGMRVNTMSFISTHIPWEAVSEISVTPSGGGVQLGWRL